jgi:non-ribosomal peptide synthetase component F
VLIAPADSPLTAALPSGTTHIVPEDPLSAAATAAPFTAPAPVAGQIAYILFTSGSTGRPKGVEVPRAAFANFLQSMAAEPGMKAGERVLAITTTAFDIAA